MLQICERSYDLVRGQSGFRVTLDPSESDDFWQQQWTFEAHYVPADSDPGPPPPAPFEYLRVMISPLWLAIKDWRDLTSHHPADFEVGGFYPGASSIENLLMRGINSSAGAQMIFPDEFHVRRHHGYLFTCEFSGAIDPEEEKESEANAPRDFQLRDEIPFAGITVRVPINAADPLTTARAIAARELGLTECARTYVWPYDPTPRRHFRSLGTDKHEVILETPWRLQK